jgi:protein-S-isoprenylcysteine O-methyltransferase Ste14
MASQRFRVPELVSRTLVGALFALMAGNLLSEFFRTQHLTGLLLVVSEALVVFLTVLRRPAHIVDRSPATSTITAISMMGPPLLRAVDVPALAPDIVTAMVSAVGLAIVIAGKLTLGRSFGIIPANRGVVCRGPYSVMRHPIYAGYLVTHAAFIAAHPSAANVIVILIADTALVGRALLEERVLQTDATYREYCTRVSWHLVPGLF